MRGPCSCIGPGAGGLSQHAGKKKGSSLHAIAPPDWRTCGLVAAGFLVLGMFDAALADRGALCCGSAAAGGILFFGHEGSHVAKGGRGAGGQMGCGQQEADGKAHALGLGG